MPDEQETDFGFTVQEVTENLYRSHRLQQHEGVIVSFVESGSEAAEAGLAVGDLIFAVEADEIINIEDFRAALRALATEGPFLVRARRGSDTRFLLIVPRSGDNQAAAPAAPLTGS